MLARRSQIPAIHSSPACDSPNEDDEEQGHLHHLHFV